MPRTSRTVDERSREFRRRQRTRLARTAICSAVGAVALGPWGTSFADDPYVSFQGTLTSPGAVQGFGLVAYDNGAVTASTLHNAGGMNRAGEAVPGGSFDPTMTLSGNGFSAFDDNGGAGADATIVATLPGLYQTYNLAMQPAAPALVGRWAVDVSLPGRFEVHPLTSPGSRVDSVTVGAQGSLNLDYSRVDILAQAAVNVRQGGSLKVFLESFPLGSLAGDGNVYVDRATIRVGGNGQT